jgi:diguanylate cyclase (GGDEF)-like protein/PAS domain S-box-containing protein
MLSMRDEAKCNCGASAGLHPKVVGGVGPGGFADGLDPLRSQSPVHENDLPEDPIAELRSYQWALDQQSIVGVTDRKGTITYVNDLFCRITGYRAEELLGSKHSILNSGHHPREFFRDMWRTISSGKEWHGEICNRTKDGRHYWVDTTIVPKFNAAGKIEGFVSVRYDITQRKLAEQALVEENERRLRAELLLRDIIETLPNGVSAFDEADRLVLFNSAFRECYPSVASEIREGASFRDILVQAAEKGEFANISGLDTDALKWIETRVASHQSPGRPFIQELSGDRWLKVHERRSSAGYVVGVRTDVTDLKRAERHVKLQAETDPLTGLANRRLLIDQLTNAIMSRRRSDRTNALVMIDLDGFKPINDALGHDAGDVLLVEVARRIRQTVRKADLVSRLGGDEYAVLLMDVLSEANAERIVRKLLAAISEPYRIGRQTIRISASFGVALFPKGATTPLDVMKHADIALYKAKQDGRSTWAVYGGAMRKQVKRRIAMTRALQKAIEKDEIRVAFQPQLRVTDLAHCGVEALVRWNSAGKWVSPPDLIALAEESGLIVPLGDAILENTFRTVSAMKEKGLWLGKVSVNLAAAQLRDPVFAKRFLDTLSCHGLAAREFAVEITEDVMLDRAVDTIRATLNTFAEAGVRIGLDDFGTGYGSLAHLQRFPISFLKIDRSFVSELDKPDGNAAIARSIVSLAHSLNMWVVAEGIESQSQFDRLRAMGADYVQGFLFAKPMFEKETAAYLSNAPRLAA